MGEKFCRKIMLVVERIEYASVTEFIEELKTLSKYSLEIIPATQAGAEDVFYFKEITSQP